MPVVRALTELAVSVKPSTAAERGPQSSTEKICNFVTLLLAPRTKSLLAAETSGEEEKAHYNTHLSLLKVCVSALQLGLHPQLC